MSLYFKQLLSGKDIAKLEMAKNPMETMLFSFANQMQNYIYLVGDRDTGEAFVVDGCWDTNGIQECAKADNMKIVGAIATHYHFDHIGGEPPAPWNALGVAIPGLKDLSTEGKSYCFPSQSLIFLLPQDQFIYTSVKWTRRYVKRTYQRRK